MFPRTLKRKTKQYYIIVLVYIMRVRAVNIILLRWLPGTERKRCRRYAVVCVTMGEMNGEKKSSSFAIAVLVSR